MIASAPPIVQPILDKLEHVTTSAGGWQARCPAHDDQKASLSIGVGDDGRALLHCQAGCETEDVVSALGFEMGDLFPSGSRSNGSTRGKIVAEYDYRDSDGKLLYQAIRFEPKNFRQRAPDGNGGWIWKLNGVQRVLYRRQELLAADPRTGVFIVEGEKDVDRLMALGRVATCNCGGAGKWKSQYNEALRGRHAVIIVDCDETGRKHGQQVAKSLYGIAASVRILELPGLSEHGDVSDWLDAGGTVEALRELVRSTPEWKPDEKPSQPRERKPKPIASVDGNPYHVTVKNLPKIDASTGDLHETTRLAWEATALANEPPRMFRFGGELVRQETDENDVPHFRQLTEQRLRFEVARAAEFFQWVRAGEDSKEKSIHPPKDIIQNMLATPDAPLPPVVGITECPTFTPDGELLATPGYNAKARILYQPPHGFVLPDVPDNPLADEVDAARGLLLETFLGDFPFDGEAERAHALALLLQPFVRPMIAGPTPLYVVEKPTPGTGATKLVDSILHVGSGREHAVMSEARDDDEYRKRIITTLSTGSPAIVLDNVHRLDSGALSSAITAYPEWSDRRLGTNSELRAPVRCAWVATGNNPFYSNEIARRVIRIRLDAKCDRPWLRTEFQIPNLSQWTRAKRPQLVAAALTLCRAWFAAGKPDGGKSLGMFECWAAVLGGILKSVHVPGFLENLDELYEVADDEGG